MIRPEFRFIANQVPIPCAICMGPIYGWSLCTFIGPAAVLQICSPCAFGIAATITSTPEALASLDAKDRRLMAQSIKGSVTNEAVAKVTAGRQS